MRVRILLVCFLAGLSVTKGNNIPYPFSQYNYTYLNGDIGLPHNFVDDVFKDSKDFIWISTHNGLIRYDGYKFVSFTTSTFPISIKDNYVQKVCEDNFNRLWIASEGGIDIIDLKLYCNIDLSEKDNATLSKLMNSDASSIYKDGKGDIWISSQNTLYCIELDDKGAIANYYCLEGNIGTGPITSVLDIGWAVCAGINNLVKRIDKRKGHLLKAEPISRLFETIGGNWKIQCMELDADTLWVGTNNGLIKYNHFGQNFKRYCQSPESGSLSQSHITDLKLDENGTLFISTLRGLNVYNRGNDNFSYIIQNSDYDPPTLNCNFINCLYMDKNCIWVGTEIGGINLLTRGRLTTLNWKNNRTNQGSLSPSPVNAICEDKQGNMWVGTVEGGLNLMRKGSNSFEHFVSDPNNPNTLSHNSISGILLDKDNYLWAYTWGKGINRLNLNIPNNKRFDRFNEKVEGAELNFIASACDDVLNSGIWFGTTEGLHFFDKEKSKFVKVKFSLSNNRFKTMAALFIDKKNRLWVGTSKGLFIVDLFSFARSRVHFDYIYIRHKLSDAQVHVADKINCVYQDKNGTIWLGSNSNGLYKLIEDKGGTYTFKNYTIKDGLPNNNIIGIVEDANHTLWMSTDNGISQLDKRSMTFSNYTKYDGLLTNQFYWNAYWYSPSQNLIYFGNTEGLVAIDPNVPKDNISSTRVSLTGLNISGKVIYPSSGEYLDQDISDTRDIYIHESDKVFIIDFSSKRYDYNDQIRYAYYLKGYDNKWHEANIGSNSAVYTSLPPGNYVFQVKATNNKGYWSDEITEIEIHVAPFFYKSWWFMTILILLAGIALYSFFSWKTREYRRQKLTLEKTVKNRTKELDDQNKRLIEVSRKLANSTEEKISFFTHVVHEFRTPVTLINGPLEKAISLSTEPSVKESLSIARRNSKYLLSLVNELMDFRKLDSNTPQINKESGNFQAFVEYVLMPFHAYARERNIHLETFYRIDNPYIVLDYDYMRKVIINLVSNAIKFTPANGSVNIYIASLNSTHNGKQLYINVQDTGIGVRAEDQDKIFSQFYQCKCKENNPELWQNSTGIGLYSCKRIVDMHKGTIRACNNKEKGASFKILMPWIEGQPTEDKFTNSDQTITYNKDVTSDNLPQSTILIVDDNTDMRAYIHSLLTPEYSVSEAQDGAEALSIIKRQSVDLILSDLMMPVMDGLELSRQVKADLSTSHIPFLILTALVSDEQKKISYQIGVDEYLCKPFDEDMLQLRIRNILKQRDQYKNKFSATISRESLNLTIGSKDEQFLKTAFELMDENYSNSEYELESFVRDIGYSKTLVNKKLQDLTGQSIGQFIRNYRLNIARNILNDVQNRADINITEVAYTVGFNDPKYFTRCFKEFTGKLPSSILSEK